LPERLRTIAKAKKELLIQRRLFNELERNLRKWKRSLKVLEAAVEREEQAINDALAAGAPPLVVSAYKKGAVRSAGQSAAAFR
jgi:hypothetical protein